MGVTYLSPVDLDSKANEKWRFAAGAAFDSSAVESANRRVIFPMGQAWRFGVGALYQLSDKATLGLAYELLWAGDMSVDRGGDRVLPGSRGPVAGSYQDSWFSFASLNRNWKF